MRLRCRRRSSQNESSPIDASTAIGITTPMAILALTDNPRELGAGVDINGEFVGEPIAEDVTVGIVGKSVACQLIWNSGAYSVAVAIESNSVVCGLSTITTFVPGTSTVWKLVRVSMLVPVVAQ